MAEPSAHLKAAQAAEQDAQELVKTAREYSSRNMPGPAAEMRWAANAMTGVKEHHERCARLLEEHEKAARAANHAGGI